MGTPAHQPPPPAPLSRSPHTHEVSATSGADDRRRWPWSTGHTMLFAALWLIGLVALAILSIAARGSGPFTGDVGLERWIQQLHQPTLVRIVNFASDANWPQPAGVIAIAVIVALALTRHIRAAIAAAVGSFGADYLNVTLNGLVKRPRPYGDQIHAVAHLGLYSYPSGHVTHVLAFYGFLLYLSVVFARKWPAAQPFWWTSRVVCLYFILFIGPSRLLEGEHWPSDVLASYLLGALMLVLGIVVYHLLGMVWARIRERSQQNGETSAPPAGGGSGGPV